MRWDAPGTCAPGGHAHGPRGAGRLHVRTTGGPSCSQSHPQGKRHGPVPPGWSSLVSEDARGRGPGGESGHPCGSRERSCLSLQFRPLHGTGLAGVGGGPRSSAPAVDPPDRGSRGGRCRLCAWGDRMVGPRDPLSGGAQSVWWASREAPGRLQGLGKKLVTPRRRHDTQVQARPRAASASPQAAAAGTALSGRGVFLTAQEAGSPTSRIRGLVSLRLPTSPHREERLRELSGSPSAGAPFLLRTPAPPRAPLPTPSPCGLGRSIAFPGTFVWSELPGLVRQADVGQASTELGTRLCGQPTAIKFVNSLCSSRTFTESRILLGKPGKTPFSWQKNM